MVIKKSKEEKLAAIGQTMGSNGSQIKLLLVSLLLRRERMYKKQHLLPIPGMDALHGARGTWRGVEITRVWPIGLPLLVFTRKIWYENDFLF